MTDTNYIKQEPVAWKDLTYGNLHHQDFGNSIPLYTHPVQQVDLTDDEIMLAVGWNDTTNNQIVDIGRAVIAAYKEKQNVKT